MTCGALVAREIYLQTNMKMIREFKYRKKRREKWSISGR